MPEKKDPHSIAPAKCGKCGKEWIAVYPTGTEHSNIECPVCHQQGSTMSKTHKGV